MSMVKTISQNQKKYDELNSCNVVLLHLTNASDIKTALEQEFAGLDAIVDIRAQAQISAILHEDKPILVLCFCLDEVYPCSGEVRKIKQVLRGCKNKKILVEEIFSNGDPFEDLEKARKYCRTKFKKK